MALLWRPMRIPVVALLSVLGLPPCSAADPSRGGTGLLVIENASSNDLAFEMSVAGKRVPGCFWVLRGRTTTFELPAGPLSWAYSVSGTLLSGNTQLSSAHPQMLRCRLGQAGLGGDVAKCEPAVPPETLPPRDGMAVLSNAALGSLEELARVLEKNDPEPLSALLDPPFDVEWLDGTLQTRRVKSAKHLLEVREHLRIDAKALAGAKARAGDPREGEDDCAKNEVDWAKGGPALTCTGREIVVALRPSAACGPSRRVDTWTLRNPSSSWLLAHKGVKPTPR